MPPARAPGRSGGSCSSGSSLRWARGGAGGRPAPAGRSHTQGPLAVVGTIKLAEMARRKLRGGCVTEMQRSGCRPAMSWLARSPAGYDTDRDPRGRAGPNDPARSPIALTPGDRRSPRSVEQHLPPQQPRHAWITSHVEAELHDVAVVHDVVLALDADLAPRLRLRHRTGVHQVVEPDDLGLDEPALEVGVDDPGRLRGRPALPDRPRPRLLGTGGEERLQAEGVEADAGQLVQAGLRLADTGEQLCRLG